MINKKDIPYRKILPPKSSKQMGRGGPRDMQRKYDMGSVNINMPKVDMQSIKYTLLNNKETREELKSEIRKEMLGIKEGVVSKQNLEGIGLPFDVVEQKLKEVIEQTEKQARERYESGIGSLNSQLNVSKAQLKEYKQEIIQLKDSLRSKEKLIEDKDAIIDKLRDQQNEEAIDLRTTILELLQKIKTGAITQDNYVEESRPILDDRIFIDPLDSVETELDSYINVVASGAKVHKRDLKSDVEKLKGLLGSGKFKPVKAKLDN